MMEPSSALSRRIGMGELVDPSTIVIPARISVKESRAINMARVTRFAAVAALLSVAACGTSNTDAPADQPAPTARSASGAVKVGAEAKWIAAYKSLPELVRGPTALPDLQKGRRVVIGTVTAEREGVELLPVDEPPREVTRVLTIKVDQQIMGTAEAGDTMDISTLGWVTDGERRTPVTYDGVPWVKVGDRVLISALAPDESGLSGQDSPDSMQVIEGGKVVIRQPGGGVLAEKLKGQSERDLIADLRDAVSTAPAK